MRLGLRPRWPFDQLVRALHRLQRVHPLGAGHLEEALGAVELGQHRHPRARTRVARTCVAAARRVAAGRASPPPCAEQQLLVCELLRLEEDGGHRLVAKSEASGGEEGSSSVHWVAASSTQGCR